MSKQRANDSGAELLHKHVLVSQHDLQAVLTGLGEGQWNAVDADVLGALILRQEIKFPTIRPDLNIAATLTEITVKGFFGGDGLVLM